MALITGDAIANFLNGTIDDDQMLGLGGNDTLAGLAGNDILTGGEGNDIIDGGDGTDTYDISDRFQGFTVNLGTGQSVSIGGPFEADTIINIEDVFGSSGNDVIIGNGERNTLQGLGGNDTVSGLGGNDTLLGGDGADSIFGGDGDDLIVGDPGNDQLDGGAGFDFVTYFSSAAAIIVNFGLTSSAQSIDGTGTDTLVSIESIAGTDFADTFTVNQDFVDDDGTGFTSIRGGAGNDTINGNGETRIDYVDASAGVRVDVTAGLARGIQGDAGVGVDAFNGVAQVRGSNFDDIILGSDASSFESFRGQSGNDFIDGRGGSSDRADYQSSPGAVNVDLASRTAQDGFGTLDFLFNIEDVRGSNFNDALAGDASNNTFRGRAGDDLINGRDGFDTADYRSDATAGINVTLGSLANVAGDISVGIDALSNIERVLGSRFDDVFLAEATFDNGGGNADQPARQLFNVFRGGGGDDQINGNGVTRIEYVGATSGIRVDLAAGEAFAIDTEIGAGIGTDILTASSVFEVRGSKFGDVLVGSANNPIAGFESFIGEDGNDSIDGGAGRDRVSYSTSTAGVFVNLENGTANDGFGTLDFLFNIEDLRGSNFDDVLIGSTGNNVIEGLAGQDDIRGGEGVDTVEYDNLSASVRVDLRIGDANKGINGGDDLLSIENVVGSDFGDIVIGSTAENRIEGLGGNDRLVGLAGNDQMFGGSGNDVLFGNSGNDILQGGAGNDRLIGGFGDDVMTGGVGNDTYYVDSSGDLIFENAGSGTDTVIIAPGASVIAFANVEIFILDFGPGQNGTLSGLAGAETLIGGSGDDTLQGNAGDDVLIGSGGDDLLNGGADNDLLKGHAGTDLIFGGDGDDVIIGGSGNDALEAAGGGATNTVVIGFPNPVTNQPGLRGDAGVDRINGQSGDDFIEGGAGGDRLIGGTGNDVLVGGVFNGGGDGAQDRFLFSSGSGLDVISDFENGIDKIDFRGLNAETGLFPTFDPLEFAIGEDGDSNATITLGNGNAIKLLGVTAAELDATDFILINPVDA